MEYQTRVIQLVTEALQTAKTVTPSKLLVEELGFDSIGLLELMASVEDEFDMIVTLDEARAIRSVQQLIDAVRRHLATLVAPQAAGGAHVFAG
ncbi:acyl carrier protein [Derxia gummosa]|uniref:Acyl carrier protein n=1 Tax=Derxia gummosa DSM 723 TaxID=1121388 RepID=A0A8B6X572_9BURK|nr:acyl carrier protein [Derxia gummosa]